MPKPTRRLRAAWPEEKAAPQMAGYGYQYGYGPTWSDQFRFRLAPTPQDLVENYKALIYTCVNLNANAVARGTLRMYAVRTHVVSICEACRSCDSDLAAGSSTAPSNV